MSNEKCQTDLIGKKFGKLKVLKYAGLDTTKKNSKWECICDCGNIKIVGRPNLRGGHTRSCGCLNSPPEMDYRIMQFERFNKYVEKTDTCWIWKGTLDKSGYGMFNYRSCKRKAHRYSFEYFNGKIHSGNFICHTCDNRSCVNPKHLYSGTHLDNMKDVSDRLRWGKPRKKLSEKQINACKILAKNGVSSREIGELLNISCQCVLKYLKEE